MKTASMFTALLLAAATALAQGAPKAVGEGEAPKGTANAGGRDRPEEKMDFQGGADLEDGPREIQDVEPLGKTVKVSVRLVSAADKAPKTLYVVSAGTRYAVSAALETETKESRLEIVGSLKLQKDGGVLTGCHALLVSATEKGMTEFSASGSVVLRPGKWATVASLGERTLTVRVEEVGE